MILASSYSVVLKSVAEQCNMQPQQTQEVTNLMDMIKQRNMQNMSVTQRNVVADNEIQRKEILIVNRRSDCNKRDLPPHFWQHSQLCTSNIIVTKLGK